MHERFGVSPFFFSLVSSQDYCGNASFMRMDNEKCVAVGEWVVIRSKFEYSFIWILINLVSTFADGFYRRFTLKDGLGYTTHVWFSHSLTDNQSSTYIIHRCPEQAKDLIIAYTNKEKIPMLLRPMAIDVFLSEYVLNAWSEAVVPRRDRLIFFVCVAEILHRLNLPWHYIPRKKIPSWISRLSIPQQQWKSSIACLSTFISFRGT